MGNLSIRGKEINRLVTKFQYDGKEMCFEISLRIKENSHLVLFLKTNDYGKFRKAFDELMNIRAENELLELPGTIGGSSPQGIYAA